MRLSKIGNNYPLSSEEVVQIANHYSLIIFLKDHPVLDSYIVNFLELADYLEYDNKELNVYVRSVYDVLRNLDNNTDLCIKIGASIIIIPSKTIASFQIINTGQAANIAGNSHSLLA